jgi:hypothetical protein
MLVPKLSDPLKNSIIIGGPMYSGKSTVGKLLMATLTHDWEIMPLAQTIKELVNLYYGLTADEANAIKEEIRPDYQHFGTETVRNNYKDDFWTIMALRKGGEFLIFDDTRYPNEIEIIKNHSKNVYGVWVEASKEVRKIRCEAKHGVGTFKNTNHSSEQGFTGEESFWRFRVPNHSDDFGNIVKYTDKIACTVEYEIP